MNLAGRHRPTSGYFSGSLSRPSRRRGNVGNSRWILRAGAEGLGRDGFSDEKLLLGTASQLGSNSSLPDITNSIIGGMEGSTKSKTQKLQFLSDDDDVMNWQVCVQEVGQTLRLAFPLVLQLVSMLGLTLVMTSSVGQLGPTQLSAASLGISLYYLSGLAVVVGVTGAMEPLCGQAFGAKNYRMVGVVCQRALVVAGCVCLAISLMWTQAERFLISIGQVPTLASMAAKFIRFMTPVLFLEAIFAVLSKYLTSQGVVYPMLVASVAALSTAPFFCNFFIHQLGLGLHGGPIALCGSFTVLISVLVTLVAVREAKFKGKAEQTFTGWSMEAFSEIGPYLRIALPLVAVTCLEWWGYETMLFAAGWLENPHLAIGAMGISNSVVNITYMLPLGLSSATTALISNRLGENRPKRAKLVAKMAMVLSIGLLSAVLLGQVAFREVVARLWTSDSSLIKLTTAVIPIVALSEVFSGPAHVMFGILHACKRGSLGMKASLVSYWAVGIPLAFLLAFYHGWGVRGFWWGMTAASVVQAFFLFSLLKGFDFSREVVRREKAAPVAPVG
ncbi:hypothetical protein BSKO_04641 [Bryopsis sp. KO-2023]|nr:hypothetical protein BSKO_04641 [Bryopsis sp. KO-2023]